MFKVLCAGYNYIHPDGWEIDRPEGCNNYMMCHIRNPFYFVPGGKGNEAVYIDHPGFVIYRPQEPQHYYLHNDKYVDNWVHFEVIDEDIDALFDKLELKFSEVISISDAYEISSLHQLLAAENWIKGQHQLEIMDHLLHAVFLRMSDQLKTEKEQKTCFRNKTTLENYRPVFDSLRERIYQGGEAARIKNIDELASEMNLSVSYFQHIYIDLYGVPVTRDIISSRINYASYLLLNHNDTISNIAGICGYDSVEHFNRQFHRVKGCSPKQYRLLGNI